MAVFDREINNLVFVLTMALVVADGSSKLLAMTREPPRHIPSQNHTAYSKLPKGVTDA